MATLTAITNPAGWVELTVTADPGEYETVTVSRLTASGSRVVRDASDADISSGVFYVTDFELPQSTSLSYVATLVSGSTTTTTDVVVTDGIARTGDYLASVGSPLSGVAVNVEGIPEEATEIIADTARVLNRPDPVVVSYGRLYWAGELKLITLTDAERIALDRILQTGKIVMFSARPGYGYEDVLYFAVGKVTRSRPSTAGAEQARQWTLEVQRVESPPPQFSIAAGVTWQERADTSTWLYWNVSATSWLDFAGV